MRIVQSGEHAAQFSRSTNSSQSVRHHSVLYNCDRYSSTSRTEPQLNLEKSILATHADGGNQSKTFGCQHQNSAAYKLGYAFSHSIALKKESNN